MNDKEKLVTVPVIEDENEVNAEALEELSNGRKGED